MSLPHSGVPPGLQVKGTDTVKASQDVGLRTAIDEERVNAWLIQVMMPPLTLRPPRTRLLGVVCSRLSPSFL